MKDNVILQVVRIETNHHNLKVCINVKFCIAQITKHSNWRIFAALSVCLNCNVTWDINLVLLLRRENVWEAEKSLKPSLI